MGLSTVTLCIDSGCYSFRDDPSGITLYMMTSYEGAHNEQFRYTRVLVQGGGRLAYGYDDRARDTNDMRLMVRRELLLVRPDITEH